MRQSERMIYLEAYKTIQELESSSNEVREYLKNLQLLKSMSKDPQSLEDLQENIDEKQYEDIMKLIGSVEQTKIVGIRQIDLNSRKKVVLNQGIINEFQKVIDRGTSSIELNVKNLSDYLLKEVLIELKPSVAKIIELDGKILCVISGRKAFVERIRQLIE